MRRGVAALGAAAVVAALVARKAVDIAEGPAQVASARGRDLPVDGGGAPGLLSRAGRHASTRPGAGHVAPPSWEPRPLTMLAGWVPPCPRGRWGTAAAYLWAAPMTLGGLLAGAASLARPRPREGVLLFSPARGLAGGFLRLRGFSAMALGHVVVARHEPSAGLMAHELAHVRQTERLGPLMAPLYLALLVVYGYARHPLERAARLAQRRLARGAS